MRRIPEILVLGALAASACTGTAAETDAVVNPFADQVLAELDDLGPDGTVTELVAPIDVFVVADGDAPVVLLRKDPNIGCRLFPADDLGDVMQLVDGAAFVDQCHGRQYDLGGQPVAGPAERPMNTLPTEVRDGELVWDRSTERARFAEAIAEPG